MVTAIGLTYIAHEGKRGDLCIFVRLPSVEVVMVEELKLVESIAAVRMGARVVGDRIEGVAVTIPAGEVIKFDRTDPLVNQLLPMEWNGSRYGVFLKDLLERTDKPASHHVDNPGIVPIHRTRSQGE